MTCISSKRLRWLLPFLALGTACMSKPIDQPARLTSVNEATLTQIRDLLKQALGKQNIALGPQTVEATTITLLPPPLGGYDVRSTAVPEILDIVKRGNSCFLLRRTPAATIALPGISCTPLAPKP